MLIGAGSLALVVRREKHVDLLRQVRDLLRQLLVLQRRSVLDWSSW